MGETCPQTRPCYCAALRPNGRAAWRPSIPPAKDSSIAAKAKGAVSGCPDPAELAKTLRTTLPNFPIFFHKHEGQAKAELAVGKRAEEARGEEGQAMPSVAKPAREARGLSGSWQERDWLVATV